MLFNWVNHTCLARELLHILRFEKLCHPRQGMPASRTSALQEGPSYIRKRLNVKDFTLVMILKCFLGKTKGNITSSPGHLSFNSCFFVSVGKLAITCKYSKPQMLPINKQKTWKNMQSDKMLFLILAVWSVIYGMFSLFWPLSETITL